MQLICSARSTEFFASVASQHAKKAVTSTVLTQQLVPVYAAMSVGGAATPDIVYRMAPMHARTYVRAREGESADHIYPTFGLNDTLHACTRQILRAAHATGQ